MTNSLKGLQSLIAEHTRLWQVDCAAWHAFGNINECEAARTRPALRVQIGSIIMGRNENGQDIKEPKYFSSEKAITDEFRRWEEYDLGLIIRRNDVDAIAKRKQHFDAKIAAKVAELSAIQTERKRIEDACGYTAAEEKLTQTGAAVKAIETQIIGFVPEDIETARLLASWAVDSYENEVGYLVCDDDQRFQVLASIAGMPVDNSVDIGEEQPSEQP